MNKIIPIIFVSFFFFYSCKTTKNVLGGKIKDTTAEELDKKIQENIIQFHTFSGKANINATSADFSQSVTAQIDILKDSVIGISLRVLGIEGMRIRITPDSIEILDRLNQQYIPRGFNFIEETFSLPVNFSDLQNLIVGNPVFYSEAKLTMGTSDDKYILFAQKDVYKNTLWLTADLDIVRMFIEDLNNQRNLTLSYSGFDKIEGRKFAFIRSVLIDTQNDLTADIEFSKITFDLPFEFSFSVNPKYERID